MLDIIAARDEMIADPIGEAAPRAWNPLRPAAVSVDGRPTRPDLGCSDR
ncbi:hypothetical protein [Nocardia brevicatena]|nr:hypothetical protein [Nocardia brevicatena]